MSAIVETRPAQERAFEARALPTYRDAFREWMCTGDRRLASRLQFSQPSYPYTAEESRALSTAVGTAAGFWVSDEWLKDLLVAANDVSPMRRACTTFSTRTGATAGWPTTSDVQEGEIVAEGASASELDVSAGRIQVPTFLFSSGIIRASWALVQDLGDDFPGWLAEVLGRRIGRRLNRALTVGAGAFEPTGIATAATIGVTGGATIAVTVPEIIELEGTLDSSLRFLPTTAYMLHSNTLTAIKKLTDASGRPIWIGDPRGIAPGVVNGHRVIVNDHMPTMAAGARSIVFADFNSYAIRDVREVALVRLDERYAPSAETGFLVYARHGGALLNAGVSPAVVFQNAS